jgi:hypothetical protein
MGRVVVVSIVIALAILAGVGVLAVMDRFRRRDRNEEVEDDVW